MIIKKVALFLFCIFRLSICYASDRETEVFSFKISDKREIEGTVDIIAYLGDSTDELIFPENINGITVGKISSMNLRENVIIKRIIIPKTVQELGEGVFAGCGIEECVFDKDSKLRVIPKDAFRDNNLSFLELPKSVKELGENCFRKNKFAEIPFSKRIIGIHSNAFANNEIKKVRINRYWKIYDRFITESDILEEVYYEEGCNEISFCAFEKCKNLRKLFIPSSIKIISDYAFQDCINLSEISFGEQKITLYQAEDLIGFLNNPNIYGYKSFENCPLSIKTKAKLMEIGLNDSSF